MSNHTKNHNKTITGIDDTPVEFIAPQWNQVIDYLIQRAPNSTALLQTITAKKTEEKHYTLYSTHQLSPTEKKRVIAQLKVGFRMALKQVDIQLSFDN